MNLIPKSRSWVGVGWRGAEQRECHYQSTETRSHKTEISTSPLHIKNNSKQGQRLCDLHKEEACTHTEPARLRSACSPQGGPSCSRPWGNTDSEPRKSAVNLAKPAKSKLKPHSATYVWGQAGPLHLSKPQFPLCSTKVGTVPAPRGV